MAESDLRVKLIKAKLLAFVTDPARMAAYLAILAARRKEASNGG